MSVASRITSIEGHIGDIYNTLELGGDTTQNKNIVNINNEIKREYKDFLANGIDVLWNNWEKVSGSGTSIFLNNTIKAPMKTNLKGNTSQNGTPTPSSPVEIKTTTGRQEIDVRGKNLLPYPYFTTSSPFTNNGITYTINNDGTINVNGTATGRSSMPLYGNYLVENQKDLTGRYIKGGTSNVNMYVFAHIGNQYPVLAQDTGQGAEIDKSNYQKGYIELVVTQGTTVNNELIKPMMLNSLDDTTYEEYKSQSYEINLGKNLFHQKETTINNGITYTKNEDGSYNIKGTASTQANLYVDIPISQTELVSGQTYTFSCNKVFPNSMTIIVECYNGSTWLRNLIRLNAGQTTSTATIDLTNATFVRQTIRVYDNQTIDIENLQIQIEKGSVATSYAPYKQPIELCKIGTYQDRIYKDNGKWYLEKKIGKIVLDGSENWDLNTSSPRRFTITNANLNITNIKDGSSQLDTQNYRINTHFRWNIGGLGNVWGLYYWFNGYLVISDNNSSIANLNTFKTWLSNNNPKIYYVLATPTTTEITDYELINQLNELEKAKSYENQTNINQIADLPFELDVVALKGE